MTSVGDPFIVLGVARGAGEREIKSAFRRAAMRYHPDRNPDPGAVPKFIAATEAYEELMRRLVEGPAWGTSDAKTNWDCRHRETDPDRREETTAKEETAEEPVADEADDGEPAEEDATEESWDADDSSNADEDDDDAADDDQVEDSWDEDDGSEADEEEEAEDDTTVDFDLQDDPEYQAALQTFVYALRMLFEHLTIRRVHGGRTNHQRSYQ